MTRHITRDRVLLGACLVALPVIAAMLAWAGIMLTREEGRVAAVWLPNAMIAAYLLRARNPAALATVPLTFAACTVANVAGGDAVMQAAMLAAINAAEILIVWAGMRFLGFARPDMERLPDLLAFCAAGGVVAPTASAILAALSLGGGDGVAIWNVIASWAVADALGLLLVTPTLLILADAWARRRRPTRAELGDGLLVFTAGTIVTIAVFVQTTYPLLFVVVPVVVLHAFKQGSLGTATSVIMITLIASIATSLDHGPINLVRGGLSDQLLTLQMFLATSFAVGLPVAALLKTRDTMRDALRERHAFADFILANAGNVIFRTDAEGHWTFLNAEWEKLTGYRVAESLGRPTTRLLVPEDLAAAEAYYPKIASGEVSDCVLQQRFIDARGSVRHIEVTVQRFVDADEAFAGTVGNIRDVSERKRQETAIAESEQRFRRMAEAAPVGIYRANADGQLTYVNKVWSDKLGLAPDAMLGEGWRRALADPEPFEADPPWRNFRGAGDVRRRSARFRCADGREIWLETVTTAEFDEDGQLAGFVGVANDITEQREATAALQESRAHLSLLADNVSDAVFRLDLDGTCRYASPSARSLLGISPRALIGARLLYRLHPEDEPAVIAAFDQLAAGLTERERMAFRSERIDQPGQYNWLEANCGLVRDETSHEPCSVVASIRNIDDTKSLEADLRTERDRAESAALAKSAFLANMSHEIRTPMNGVIGFTDVLLQSDLSPVQRRHVEMIADSGRTMMQLLNDILDISKIEAGQMRLQEEPVDIRHKTIGAVRLMQPIASAKGITLDLAVADGVPHWIVGDQLRLRQIILNLVGNAVKFTHEGGVMVTVACQPGECRGELAIHVADTGIGIAEDRLTMIFEEFNQADGSTARKYGGTGLGLSISARLAQMMGGTIAVASRMGEGTTFTVRIPFAACADPSAPLENPLRDDSPRAQVPLRVLVAEDHDINQALIRSQAERIGMHVDIAPCGEQAVAMAVAARETEPYDLVLMDLQMPGMGGLEAARHLRDKGFSPDELPIVALTANAYADDIAACLAAGMQHHLAKPVQLPELQRVVERFARRDRDPSAVDCRVPGSSKHAQAGTARSAPLTIPDLPLSLVAAYHSRRREALDALRRQLVTVEPDAAEIADLAGLLHKLGGTAANFGEPRLGADALALEKRLLAARPGEVAAIIGAFEYLLAA